MCDVDLREKISDFSDEKLLEAYCSRRDDYTAVALKIIEEEVARRGLSISVKENERIATAIAVANTEVANLKREDFEPLPCRFSKHGALTANAILHDSKVPYVMEKCEDADMFNVSVYNEALSKAIELIDEHFEAGEDGMYLLRRCDVVDRLKSFSIYDIKFTDKAAQEQLDVDFSSKEKSEIIKLAQTLLDEVDKVEEEHGVVFFYDGMEPLVLKLKNDDGITRIDFLAIIELCQIYCDDPRYDSALNHVVSSILDFFMN